MFGIKSKHIIREISIELNFEFNLIRLFIQEQIRLTQEILKMYLINKEILKLINSVIQFVLQSTYKNKMNENSNQKTTLSVLDSIEKIEGEFELF